VSHPIEHPCPKCGAVKGQSCLGARGHERKSFHRGRGSRRAFAAAFPRHLKSESPIEESLTAFILGWIDHHEVADVQVETQIPIGPYRADILITSAGRRLVVECDGAEYHNSPEAIERDKRRDRYCVTQGMAVMRFIGSEVHRDPRGCAAQIGLWIRAQRS